MTVAPGTLALIVLCGLLTWATRMGGVWLIRHVRLGPRALAALDAMPGATLAAIVAPAVTASPADAAAAALTFVLARRLPAVLAIAIGIAVAMVLRRTL